MIAASDAQILPISLDDVLAARARIAPYLDTSPVVKSPALTALAGCSLFLKAENFTRTGSFKAHGAFNAMLKLTPEQRRAGVATVSAGNHGQALALAASTLGVQATIFMSQTAVKAKVAAIRALDANIDFSPAFPEAFARLDQFSRETGATIVHPFGDRDVIAGQGVIGLEILEQVPDVEQIVIPIGGGGLASGIGLVMAAMKPEVRLVGVEPVGSPTMFNALAAGTPVTLASIATIADGLSAPFTTEINLALIRQCLSDVVLVTDDEIIQAMRLLMEHTEIIAEPAGAAGLASVLTGKAAIPVGANTVVLISGGNIDHDRLQSMM